MPYNFNEYPYPGFGIKYSVRNIARTFADLELEFSDGLGTTTMGGVFSRELHHFGDKICMVSIDMAELYH